MTDVGAVVADGPPLHESIDATTSTGAIGATRHV
jgi:hypothetical protein